MAQNRKSLIKEAQELLNIVLNNADITSQLQNQAFKKNYVALLKNLNGMEKAEKIPEKSAKANTILKKFNTTTNSKEVFDKKTTSVDLFDVEDQINYIKVYFKNILKQDFEQLKKQPKTSAKKSKDSDNLSLSKSKNETTKIANANNMGGYFASSQIPGMDLSPDNNPWIIGQATAILNAKIHNGEVYIFKSKPKIMIVLKWIISLLFIIYAILEILTIVFSSQMVGTKTDLYDPNGTIYIYGSSDVTSYAITSVLFALLFFFIAWWIIKPLIVKNKDNKFNENKIYMFNWQPFAFAGVFLLMNLMIVTFMRAGNGGQIFGRLNNWANDPDNVAYKTFILAYLYTVIAQWVIFGLITISIIVAGINNPRRDLEKMETYIKQIINEITKKPGAKQ